MDFRLQQQKIMVQLDAAAKIQALFLPKKSDIESLKNIWATSIPAGSVGGDLYDIILMNDASLLFYVGDVSGKGLPAALIMAALSSNIKREAYIQKSVAALLERVNNAMFELISDQGYFATMIVGRYWPKTGMMNLCNAGHLIPMWLTQNTITKVPYEKNLAIGILKDVSYKMVELSLSPGDRMIFLSDGITEAQNEDENFFGDSRVESYIRDHKAFPLSKGLIEEVKAWRGKAEANDDLTILEIWR
jgi:serine phosphatase RsbU (regulator of sigma subunit)